jgi:hypothetical protein
MLTGMSGADAHRLGPASRRAGKRGGVRPRARLRGGGRLRARGFGGGGRHVEVRADEERELPQAGPAPSRRRWLPLPGSVPACPPGGGLRRSAEVCGGLRIFRGERQRVSSNGPVFHRSWASLEPARGGGDAASHRRAQLIAMITNDFFIAKDFRVVHTKSLRRKKSLRVD